MTVKGVAAWLAGGVIFGTAVGLCSSPMSALIGAIAILVAFAAGMSIYEWLLRMYPDHDERD